MAESSAMAEVPWFGLVMLFTVLAWLWELYLSVRQVRRLSDPNRPAKISEIVSEEEYAKAVAYSLDTLSFSMMSDAIGTMASVTFYLMDGLAWLWRVAEHAAIALGLDPRNELWVTLLFFTLYFLKSTAEGFPLELYQTFVIEHRHGFNQQTLSLWVSDQIKTILLVTLLGGPALVLGVLIIQWGGDYFYIYVWAFTLVLLLTFMTVYPNLIAPLFDTFTPLQEGELRSELEKLAAEHTFPLKKLFVVDGSKRSSHSNAYIFGFGANKRVVLYDTLCPKLLMLEPKKEEEGEEKTEAQKKEEQEKRNAMGCSVPEIVAILGHELGHWAMSHVTKQLAIAQVHLLIFFYLYGTVMHAPSMFAAFGFPSQQPTVIGLLLFASIVAPVEQAVHMAQQSLTRRFEYQADAFAVEHKRGASLAAALIKISKDNKSNLNVDPLWSAYHNSHPTLLERLEAIEKLEAKRK